MFIKLYHKIRIAFLRRANRARTVKDAFPRIYARNVWGGKPKQYHSGDGSTEHHASLYANVVVLQHLSNSQIISILHKIKKYKYVVITEHYPDPGVHFSPNKDKPHGPDTRIYDNSAVCLDLPPFNMQISKMLIEVDPYPDLINQGGKIRTFLIEN